MKKILVKIKNALKSEYAVLLICLLLLLILACTTPKFATTTNLLNVIKRTSTTGIVALGMTFVICTGGIDLSVGGVVALVGTTGALMLGNDASIPVVVIVMIALATLIGLLNGFFVAYLKLPGFMVTMAMLNVTKGLAFYFTTGKTLYKIPDAFANIGLMNVGFGGNGVPIAAIYLIVLALLCQYILTKTTLGRRILSIGGNERGAWYVGINTKRNKMLAYTICGTLTGIAAVALTARLMSASASMGDGMELDAIAAAVIGGASLAGGSGNMIGTLSGALILTMISNWMNLISVNTYLRDVVTGLIILLALIMDATRKGDMSRAKLREI